jgi:hypothetical protein
VVRSDHPDLQLRMIVNKPSKGSKRRFDPTFRD